MKAQTKRVVKIPRPVDRTGRLDLLAEGLFDRLMDQHGNPALRVCLRTIAPDISRVFRETMGPGTRAGRAAKRLVKAAANEGL